MPVGEVKLVVTQNVLKYVAAGRENERQIALRAASPEIWEGLQNLTAANRATLNIGGCIRFTIGDPGVIWHAHNQDVATDFDDLYSLLSRRPDCEMRVFCELEA